MTIQYPGQGCISNPKAVIKGDLPDVFIKPDGMRVTTKEQWKELAAIWRDKILEIEYGGLPPKPQKTVIEQLGRSNIWHWPGSPNFWSYRITTMGGKHPVSFCVKVLFPDNPGKFPAIVNGDSCWWHVSDKVAQQVIKNGYALVMFDRTELAEDLGYKGIEDKSRRSGGLYDAYPDHIFGALSAWAWGYHRCIDFLQSLSYIDKRHIAVTGHSRGGKSALIAGMTDERIALVNDNASGTGGSAAFRYIVPGAETLQDIIHNFPSWFGKELPAYAGREEELPFDQHCLLAAIAPRPLLSTYALSDFWSNPEGMMLSGKAASEVYRFLGAEDNIAFHLRKGGHIHGTEDWNALLEFMSQKWQ